MPPLLTPSLLQQLRAPSYRSQLRVAYCPQAVVFQFQPSTSSTDVVAQLSIGTVLQGAASAVRLGQTVYITTGADLRRPLFVGRVRKPPAGTTFFVDECPIAINPALRVTVVNDYRVQPRLPRVTPAGQVFVDWDQPYAAPAPLIENLQSAYVNPTTAPSAQFAFAPTANPVAAGATITAWSWDIADGTFVVGNASSQNVTVSFPQGHRWVRLTVTNSLGVSNWFAFQVWVGEQFTIPNLDAVTIEVDEDGYRASLTGYQTGDAVSLLRTLLPDTAICIYSAADAQLHTNVDFVGRLRGERDAARAVDDVGLQQEVVFEAEGFGLQAASTAAQPTLVERASAPTVWGQLASLTPARTIAHVVSAFSTFANVSALHLPNLDDYQIKAVAVEARTLLEALQQLAGYVLHRVQFAAGGSTHVVPDARYFTSSLVNAALSEEDLLELAIEADFAPSLARVEVGAERYNPSTNTSTFYAASAPPQARGAGDETVTVDGLWLRSGQPDNVTFQELKDIAGVLFANSQPGDVLTATLWGAWRDALVPAWDRWWTFALPASSNARGRAYTSAQLWQLRAVSQTYDQETGARELRATFHLARASAGAVVAVSIIPQQVETFLPVLPTLDPYPAFPEALTVNYPTDAPEVGEQQPLTPSQAARAYAMLPTDAAEDAARRRPRPRCRMVLVPMRSSAAANTPYQLTNGKAYTLTVSGVGLVGSVPSPTWVREFNFVTGTHGWLVVNDGCGVGQNAGLYQAGVGWKAVTYKSPSLCVFDRTSLGIVRLTTTTSTITRVEIDYQNAVNVNSFLRLYATTATSGSDLPNTVPPSIVFNDANPPSGAGTYIWTGSVTMTQPGLRLRWTTHHTGAGGGVTISRVKFEGTGVNPFTGVQDSTPLYADAFYTFNASGGNPAISQPTRGLKLDGVFPPTPAYNPNHTYTLSLIGDGTSLQTEYVDSAYSDNSASYLYVQICATDGSGVP
jgi:hypothetical protein